MITNINKISSNIQQAVEGTATPIHDHERAQSAKERYKNLWLPDLSNTQPPSAAPSHEQVQSVKERYKNLWLPVRYQTNEPTRDDDDALTENRRAVVATEIAHLREDNEFLASVNAEFSSENDDLKEEVNELKMKLKQYQIQSSSESLDVIDVPEERLAKRFKLDGSKKVKKTVHYAKNQPKEEQEEQREKEAKIEMKMILKTIKPNDNLDDNETFNSPKNIEIRSRLIPELRRAMFPNYKPSVAQLTNCESDEENPDKMIVCVYNYSWRSQELKNLLRNVIDSHSADIQTAKLQRPRQYDDEVQHFDRMHPKDAPQWSYVEQEDFIYDTEIDSRSGFNEDEDYGEETEEVLIDSQKSGAGDDLAE
ncbi:unnamed protein product [Rhizophagus irregularis]|nr:unnamed protein product [Rhizophagus irregularis]